MQSWLVSLAYATAEQLGGTGRRAGARGRARGDLGGAGLDAPATSRGPGDPAGPGRHLPDHRRGTLGGAPLHGRAPRPGAPAAGHGGTPRPAVAAPHRLGVGQLPRLVPPGHRAARGGRAGPAPRRELVRARAAVPPLDRAGHAARRRRARSGPGCSCSPSSCSSARSSSPRSSSGGPRPSTRRASGSSSCSWWSRSCWSLVGPRTGPRCSSACSAAPPCWARATSPSPRSSCSPSWPQP